MPEILLGLAELGESTLVPGSYPQAIIDTEA